MRLSRKEGPIMLRKCSSWVLAVLLNYTEADRVDDAGSKRDVRDDVQSVVHGMAHERSLLSE